MIGLRHQLHLCALPNVHRATHRFMSSFKGQIQQFVNEVSHEKAALVYFYTEWCEPCRHITEKLELLCDAPPPGHSDKSLPDPKNALASPRESPITSKTSSALRIIPIDIDENPKLSALHDIRSLPTFVAYREGRIVGRVEGSADDEIRKLVKKLKCDTDMHVNDIDSTKVAQ